MTSSQPSLSPNDVYLLLATHLHDAGEGADALTVIAAVAVETHPHIARWIFEPASPYQPEDSWHNPRWPKLTPKQLTDRLYERASAWGWIKDDGTVSDVSPAELHMASIRVRVSCDWTGATWWVSPQSWIDVHSQLYTLRVNHAVFSLDATEADDPRVHRALYWLERMQPLIQLEGAGEGLRAACELLEQALDAEFAPTTA